MSDIVQIVKGPFPENLAEETRSEDIKTVPNTFLINKGDLTIPTEKLDGISLTLFNDGGEVRIASEGNEVEAEDHLVWVFLDKEVFLESTHPGEAFQGELIGPGIKGNPLKLDMFQFHIHTCFNEGKPLSFLDSYNRAEYIGFRFVPLRLVYDLEEFDLRDRMTIESRISGIRSAINPDAMAEGLVYHNVSGQNEPPLAGRTFKVLNNQYK